MLNSYFMNVGSNTFLVVIKIFFFFFFAKEVTTKFLTQKPKDDEFDNFRFLLCTAPGTSPPPVLDLIP